MSGEIDLYKAKCNRCGKKFPVPADSQSNRFYKEFTLHGWQFCPFCGVTDITISKKSEYYG
jgi:rRNA maturation endonuclease Nob1